MAAPVAVVGAAQEIAFGVLPTVVVLDGTASVDPDGDPIDAYQWSPVDIPPGSAAALNDPAAAQPTFTADVPGTYLFLLQVTAGGETTTADVTQAASSALARVTVTTQHRDLVLPAAHERDWADRMNGNLTTLDALAGQVDGINGAALAAAADAAQGAADAAQADADANAAALAAHAADTDAHYGPATDAALGVVRLSAEAGDPADPVVIVEDDANWQTLTTGADADGLHTHPTLVGHHHVLRPDLLTGPSDKRWTALEVGALAKSSGLGAERGVGLVRSPDGLLQIDISPEASHKLAGAVWPGVAGPFVAETTLRLSFNGHTVDLNPGAAHSMCLGFGWMDGDDLTVARDLRAVGLVVRGGSMSVLSVGTTPAAAGTDWDALADTVLEPFAAVAARTEIAARIVRDDTSMYAEVQLGGGGWIRVNDIEWDTGAGAAGYFTIFGSLSDAVTGLRIKSSGFRIAAAETWSAP